MSKIIIVNTGSASKKYALFEDKNLLMNFHFEKSPDGYLLHQSKDDKFNKDTKISEENYEQAFDYCIELLLKDSYIKFDTDIDAVVFRIVAPGKYFAHDRLIEDEFLERLDAIREQAPLHIDNMNMEFNQVTERLPKVKMVGISDSRFHNTIPQKTRIYSLPRELSEKYEIYKYGYHGVSVSSIVNKIKNTRKNFPQKAIICHLGGGSSVTALCSGESIDNSMGYSPLEGITMTTRIGNIDPGAIISLADQADLDLSEIRDILYNNSGLLGISGKTTDIRELIRLIEEEKDTAAQLALDNYVGSIKKQIGAAVASMNGIDEIIFTGTIGERSDFIREKVCENMDALGIEIDHNLNKKTYAKDSYINIPNSKVSIFVCLTNESQNMADRAVELI